MSELTKTLNYKRVSKKLEEVIDTDLLTATERFFLDKVGGFYKMSDEPAYFKMKHSEGVLSVDQFQKKLRKELHKNFFIAYNPHESTYRNVTGHLIGFYIPEWDGFIPLFKVGKSGENEIHPESQGYTIADNKVLDGSGIVWRGWIAGFEGAKEFIKSLQVKPPKFNKVIGRKEFFMAQKLRKEIGGETILHDIISKASQINAVERAKEIEDMKTETEKLESEKKILLEAQIKSEILHFKDIEELNLRLIEIDKLLEGIKETIKEGNLAL